MNHRHIMPQQLRMRRLIDILREHIVTDDEPVVDMAAHAAKQYMACSGCAKPVTIEDFHKNECPHCGRPIYQKKGKV